MKRFTWTCTHISSGPELPIAWLENEASLVLNRKPDVTAPPTPPLPASPTPITATLVHLARQQMLLLDKQMLPIDVRTRLYRLISAPYNNITIFISYRSSSTSPATSPFHTDSARSLRLVDRACAGAPGRQPAPRSAARSAAGSPSQLGGRGWPREARSAPPPCPHCYCAPRAS